MKAITTKYLGCTNTRGSRIVATDSDGNKATIPYPHELSGEAVHAAAALQLCGKMGWTGELIGGGTATGYVFVFAAGEPVADQMSARHAQVIPLREIYAIVGCGASGLGAPSKMPCPAYSLPASACITGAKLATIAGSTCEKCYAMRGNYQFANVQETLQRRLASITDPLWPAAMATLIARDAGAAGHFRWHDSGDLQSTDHLEKIAEVCRRTPQIRHWLPTREYGIVRAWIRGGGIVPENLAIRISAAMIDGDAPTIYAHDGERLPVSYVHATGAPQGRECPAPSQGNFCGDCRACWDARVDVSYHKH